MSFIQEPAEWSWLLCSGYGTPLAELTTALGKQLKFSRNTFTEAQCVISHEDEAAHYLIKAMEEGPMPTLRCYRRSAGNASSVLRFNGYLAPFTEELEEQGLMTLMFRSPFGRLYGDGTTGIGRYTGASIECENKEQGQVAKSLILLYGGGGTLGLPDATFGALYKEASSAGLGIGEIAVDGVTRSVNYRYSNVGQAIINLSECLNGFDFDETPVEGGEILANFNTYVSQGASKPGAMFQYGPSTLANLTKVQRTVASPANVVILVGAEGLVATVENAESISKYGKWYFVEQCADATNATVLKSRAEALIRTTPRKTLALFPDFSAGSCPRPFDDFWLGDTVPFYGVRGAFEEQLETRVNEIDVVIDDNGYETAAVPDPHSATAESPDLLHTVFKVAT